MNLDGKHILIVGASSGIGMEMVEMFSKQGAKLTLTTRNKEKLEELKQHAIVEVDVNNVEDMRAVIAGIDSVDGIVYNPGVVKLFPVKFINEKHLSEVRTPIFDGAVHLMSALLKKKKINNGASIVFISSISSKFPYKGGAIYTSSKAALETYSKTLALELADRKIRSNCIKAGLVATKILKDTQDDMPDELYENHIKRYPLGIGHPEDVASASAFLLSDFSKWITGTEIVLDGGLTAGA